MAIRSIMAQAMVLGALSATLLVACGGGGEPQANDKLSDNAATSYSANATVVGSDATSALDTALLTAMQLAPGAISAASAPNSREQAQTVSVGTLTCAGGGTATMTISGAGTVAELNGRLDAGEIYQITYNQCSGANGQAALNGALAMTVNSASSNIGGNSDTTVTFSTSSLAATLPRGSVSFNGTVMVQRVVTVSGNSTSVSTQVSTSSLAVATNFNNRTGQFTLSGVNLTRQANFLSGVLQSASYNGAHTLSAVLTNLSYSYTVATQGGTAFDANGVPTQGGWVITLPNRTLTITVASGSVTIAIDDGKNGSVDRSFTIPVAALIAGAG